MSLWQYEVVIFRKGMLGWKWSDEGMRSMGLEEGLNSLGARGYELVAAMPDVEDGTTEAVEYVFKKALGS